CQNSSIGIFPAAFLSSPFIGVATAIGIGVIATIIVDAGIIAVWCGRIIGVFIAINFLTTQFLPNSAP
ncbi:MAG: hypothetical protein KAQ66_10410, partial [Rhodospirillaceae bacterium]|nr:hypothetical protein [Rhodospirillaceae bacterium]